MRVLPSTVVIAIVGVAAAAWGTTQLAMYGGHLSESRLSWCFVAVMGGIAVLLGAIARELILRAPPERYRKIMSDAALGGMSVGLDVTSGGHGHGHGGGDSGGGDGGGGGGGH